VSKETKMILTVKDRVCSIENDKGKVIAVCKTLEEVKDELTLLGLVMPINDEALRLFG